jgi:hypothetical protein
MITKFNSIDDNCTSIEFGTTLDSNLLIEITESAYGVDEYLRVHLSKQDLFNLIGQLLRIQAELKSKM